MIFNKFLSIVLSACLFLFLMLLTSSVAALFFNGGSIPFIGVFFVVIYYFIARAFYSYLRNDDKYKNTRKHKSDKKENPTGLKVKAITKTFPCCMGDCYFGFICNIFMVVCIQ